MGTTEYMKDCFGAMTLYLISDVEVLELEILQYVYLQIMGRTCYA